MTPAMLSWTVAAALLWASAYSQSQSSVVLSQEPVTVRYPANLSSHNMVCDCDNYHTCESVSWFRVFPQNGSVLFLVSVNKIGRNLNNGPGVKMDRRWKFSTTKSGVSYTLRIENVTMEDAGIYSCVLKTKQKVEVWKSGFLLLPGVTPPTQPPPTKAQTVPSGCRCNTKKKNFQKVPVGCGSMVLWPLVGIVMGLAVALISTLYYFSRLPRKCKHRFEKKRQMR